MSKIVITKEEAKILSYVDHTLLKQESTWADIKQICDDGVLYKVASVCIPPSYVKRASEYLAGKLPVCTVIGFPNGYNTTEVKVYEAKKAIEEGADEIDMVINIGDLKAKDFQKVENEIKALREATSGKILKVIIETCLLNEDEKIKMCEIVTSAKADFIKTSTGFSKGGATLEDINLFRKNVGPSIKMKAAGGISSLEDAKAFIDAGATRLGTSRVIKIIKTGSENHSGY